MGEVKKGSIAGILVSLMYMYIETMLHVPVRRYCVVYEHDLSLECYNLSWYLEQPLR